MKHLSLCILLLAVSLHPSVLFADVSKRAAVKIAKQDVRASKLWQAQRKRIRTEARKECALKRRIKRQRCVRKQFRRTMPALRFELFGSVDRNDSGAYVLILGSKGRTQVAEYVIGRKKGRVLNRELRPMRASDLPNYVAPKKDKEVVPISQAVRLPVPSTLPATSSSDDEEESNHPETPAKAVSGFQSIIFDSPFNCPSSWTEVLSDSAFDGSYLESTVDDPEEYCEWAFTTVDAGRYKIYVSFPNDVEMTPLWNEAEYEIYLDDTLFYSTTIDQSFNDRVRSIENADFELLYSGVLAAANTLAIRLVPTSGMLNPIAADAIYIEEIPCDTPTGLLPGDGNLDGRVDAADYTVWRNNLGLTLACPSDGDYDQDGGVDHDDYQVWRDNYGLVAPPKPGDFSFLEPVEIFEASLTTQSELTFRWEDASGAARYTLVLADGADPFCSNVLYRETTTETEHAIPYDLDPGRYSVCLQAVNFNGITSAQNSITFFEIIEFNLLTPIPHSYIPRDLFEWETAVGTDSYLLKVDRVAPIVQEDAILEDVSGTSFTIPTDEQGLLNGHYQMQLWAKYGETLVEATNSPALFTMNATRVFVTADEFGIGSSNDGTQFLSLTGADSTCKRVGEEEEGHIFPSERFVAIAGDTSSPVVARMGPFTRPIYDLFGDYVGADGPTIVANGPEIGITVTEDLTVVSTTPWTGAIIGGSVGNTCSNWSTNSSSSYGSVGAADDAATNEFWIGGLPPVLPQADTCSSQNPLFCIGPIPSPRPQE